MQNGNRFDFLNRKRSRYAPFAQLLCVYCPPLQQGQALYQAHQIIQGTKTMFSAISQRIRNIHNYRKTVTELTRMDDRMLNDIGVLRGDIERMVRVGR